MHKPLIKRPLPNPSIKLRPPSSHPKHAHKCECPMCNLYEPKKQQQILAEQQMYYKKKLSQQLGTLTSSNCNCNVEAYEWIINRLILPHNKIAHRGIQIFIPQTVFYKDGEPTALFKNKEIHEYKVRKVPKQKINQTYIQKQLNERRRKYRDQVQIRTGQKVVQKNLSMFAKKQQKIDTKDACIIQYLDHTQQLITQNQLLSLMLKRKQDPIWKKILLIKNFITSKQISLRLHKINFSYQHHSYPDLFLRTQLLMKIYAGNILKGQKQYVNQEDQELFCQHLRDTQIPIFAQYMVYKLVAWVQCFYDQKINKLQCAILVNQFNRAYLVDVYKLQKQDLVKYSWTNQTYRLKIQQQENRIFMNDKQIVINPRIQQTSLLFTRTMEQKYEQQKQKYGLTMNPQDTTQENLNNKFFSFLHPQFKQQLSEVLKKKDLSIANFKKTYLGFEPQRKSVTKPFNSNFVKTLHSLTARVKFSPSKSVQSNILKTIDHTPSKTFRSRIIDSSGKKIKNQQLNFSTIKKIKNQKLNFSTIDLY